MQKQLHHYYSPNLLKCQEYCNHLLNKINETQ